MHSMGMQKTFSRVYSENRYNNNNNNNNDNNNNNVYISRDPAKM